MTKHHLARAFAPFALTLVITGGALFTGHARAATPTPVAQTRPSTPVIAQKDNGTWQYVTTASESGQIQVAIGHDSSSVQALKAFAQANRDLAKPLVTPGAKLDALITFNRPFTIDDFKKFVTDNQLSVSGYTLRATAPDGHRWTIGGTPRGGDLVPQDLLDKQFAYTVAHAPGAGLNGVVDVTVSFDAAQFGNVQATQGVFLVDITRTVAVAESRLVAPQVVGTAKVLVDEAHPYWALEDLGPQNFR